MNSIELFEKFATGEITDTESVDFYSALSINGEMRAEFQSFMNVSKSLKTASTAFAPSIESKSRIFERAGFAMPINAINSANNAITTVPKSKQYSYIGYGLLSGSIITAIIFLLFINNQVNSFNKNNYSDNYPSIKNDNINEVVADYPNSKNNYSVPYNSTAIKSNELSNKYSNDFSNRINNKNNSYSEQNTKANNTGITPIPEAEPKSNVIDESSDVHKNTEINYIIDKSNTSSEIINSRPKYYSSIQKLSHDLPHNVFNELSYIIEAKNSFAWHSNQSKVDANKLSPFNNFNIAVYYELSDNVRLGAEVKQETFLPEYTGIESNGYEFRYAQLPNFTTFSIVSRMLPFNFAGFKPFAQIGFGFNRGGYTAKPEFGLEYKLSKNIALITAFEYTHFWFFHGSNWFNTKKIGVSYGLSYKF